MLPNRNSWKSCFCLNLTISKNLHIHTHFKEHVANALTFGDGSDGLCGFFISHRSVQTTYRFYSFWRNMKEILDFPGNLRKQRHVLRQFFMTISSASVWDVSQVPRAFIFWAQGPQHLRTRVAQVTCLIYLLPRKTNKETNKYDIIHVFIYFFFDAW